MAPIIHLVRHAQGVHNLSHANHHLLDPELTPLGEEQARALGADFPSSENVQLILASPLRRTIQTALFAFSSQLKDGQKVLAWPDVQEVSDLDCDTGSDLPYIKAKFDQEPVDFGLVEPGWHIKEGKWSSAVGKVLERAQLAREWLSKRPEKQIVVVSHGCFLHFLTDDWANAVNSHATDWANTEVRTFSFVHDQGQEASLRETPDSRKRRGKEPVTPTEEERLELRETALQTWVQWGVVSA